MLASDERTTTAAVGKLHHVSGSAARTAAWLLAGPETLLATRARNDWYNMVRFFVRTACQLEAQQ